MSDFIFWFLGRVLPSQAQVCVSGARRMNRLSVPNLGVSQRLLEGALGCSLEWLGLVAEFSLLPSCIT